MSGVIRCQGKGDASAVYETVFALFYEIRTSKSESSLSDRLGLQFWRAERPSHSDYGWLRSCAERAAESALNRQVIVTVWLDAMHGLPDQVFAIEVFDLADPRSAGRDGSRPFSVKSTDDDFGVPRPGRADGPKRRLHVFRRPSAALDSKRTWSYDMTPGSPWVPFGRDLELASGEAGFELGPARAVPRGRLVQLRLVGGELRMRRTSVRPEYVVTVGGSPLHPGAVTPVASSGTLRYAKAMHPAVGTELEFVLEDV